MFRNMEKALYEFKKHDGVNSRCEFCILLYALYSFLTQTHNDVNVKCA